MTLNISVENPKYVETPKSGSARPYYSFAVRLLYGPLSLAVSGFKFFPDNASLSTPSQFKGNGKYFNTCSMSKQMYYAIQTAAATYFGTQVAENTEEMPEEVKKTEIADGRWR